jgi:SAM-dependent methyltransferase
MPRSEDKFILDATAGYRMMWFNKKHPNCIYLDQRPECEPDIVGDFRDLKQFKDETFNLIIFDPPFWIKNKSAGAYGMVRRFGYLEPETWQIDLKKGFQELWRVLKSHGILLFKWQNYQIASNDILKFAPTKPLLYQITADRYRSGSRNTQKSGTDKVQTLWFCFMKIEPEKKIPEGVGV